jgi:hypothetical protein
MGLHAKSPKPHTKGDVALPPPRVGQPPHRRINRPWYPQGRGQASPGGRKFSQEQKHTLALEHNEVERHFPLSTFHSLISSPGGETSTGQLPTGSRHPANKTYQYKYNHHEVRLLSAIYSRSLNLFTRWWVRLLPHQIMVTSPPSTYGFSTRNRNPDTCKID